MNRDDYVNQWKLYLVTIVFYHQFDSLRPKWSALSFPHISLACHLLVVCVSLKFIIWNLMPNVIILGYGNLWEVNLKPSSVGLVPYKMTQRAPLTLPLCEDTVGRQCLWACWCLDLGLPILQSCEDKCLLFKLLSPWNSAGVVQWPKTWSISVNETVIFQ